MRPLIIPGILAAFSGVVIYLALQLTRSPPMIVGHSMQPRSFPIFLMVINLILIGILAWECMRNPPKPVELEGAMMKAMGHSLYQAYLMNSGLDDTSPMGSDAWGKQIKMMVNEFGPALKEMGLIE